MCVNHPQCYNFKCNFIHLQKIFFGKILLPLKMMRKIPDKTFLRALEVSELNDKVGMLLLTVTQ
jgi:hypothetical protein